MADDFLEKAHGFIGRASDSPGEVRLEDDVGSRGYVVQHLRSAISKLNGEGPGRWKVTDCPCVDWVSLSYDVEGPTRGQAFTEEVPWRSWGGDDLLRSAGVREYKVLTGVLSSGYSTWAKIEFDGTGDCRKAARGQRAAVQTSATTA